MEETTWQHADLLAPLGRGRYLAGALHGATLEV